MQSISSPSVVPNDTCSTFKNSEPHSAGHAPLTPMAILEQEDLEDSEEIEEDRAHHVMSLLLIYKETVDTQLLISGVVCQIKASYVNGMVYGTVCSALSSKKHEFEFEPMRCLQKKSLIIAEIKRLYWEYFPPQRQKKSAKGKTGLVLCYKTE